jgi:hypothetical protein
MSKIFVEGIISIELRNVITGESEFLYSEHNVILNTGLRELINLLVFGTEMFDHTIDRCQLGIGGEGINDYSDLERYYLESPIIESHGGVVTKTNSFTTYSTNTISTTFEFTFNQNNLLYESMTPDIDGHRWINEICLLIKDRNPGVDLDALFTYRSIVSHRFDIRPFVTPVIRYEIKFFRHTDVSSSSPSSESSISSNSSHSSLLSILSESSQSSLSFISQSSGSISSGSSESSNSSYSSISSNSSYSSHSSHSSSQSSQSSESSSSLSSESSQSSISISSESSSSLSSESSQSSISISSESSSSLSSESSQSSISLSSESSQSSSSLSSISLISESLSSSSLTI